MILYKKGCQRALDILGFNKNAAAFKKWDTPLTKEGLLRPRQLDEDDEAVLAQDLPLDSRASYYQSHLRDVADTHISPIADYESEYATPAAIGLGLPSAVAGGALGSVFGPKAIAGGALLGGALGGWGGHHLGKSIGRGQHRSDTEQVDEAKRLLADPGQQNRQFLRTIGTAARNQQHAIEDRADARAREQQLANYVMLDRAARTAERFAPPRNDY